MIEVTRKEETSIKLELFDEEKALQKCQDGFLRDEWDKLTQNQLKVSVLQGRAFVVTWYKNYFPSYSPILFLAWDKDGKLIGLLALAIHREKKYLVCAGDELAEYHGWLSTPKYEVNFISSCLKVLKKKYSFYKWSLNWLAPGTNISWLDKYNLQQQGIYFCLEKSSGQIWNLKDSTKLKKINKRANVKRSYRQYKSRGNFRMEKIIGEERLDNLLKEFAAQCDFKKEAIFNRRLFDSDPHIVPFLKDLQKFPDINHFSVLWLNDRPIAFNHALVNNDELCLAGYTSYDPAESRNSPGKLHLLELAKACSEDGFASIDLTPGKDAYKSRFSNSSRDVYRLSFYFSFRSKILRNIKEVSKKLLQKLFDALNIDLYEIKSWQTDILEIISRFKQGKPIFLTKKISTFINSRNNYEVNKFLEFEQNLELKTSSNLFSFRKNDFHVLESYHEQKDFISRRALFQQSLKKFSRGDDFYSLSIEENLLAFAWVRNGKYPLQLPGTNYTHKFPENCRIIYGLTIVGKNVPQSELDSFVRKITQDILGENPQEIYLCSYDSYKFQGGNKLQRMFGLNHRRYFSFFNQSRVN